MRVLMIGDVVSSPGCEALRRSLPRLKKEYAVDFCIVNGENSAVGNGITPDSYERLIAAGADLVTGGNHSLRRPEIVQTLESNFSFLLRPVNLHRSAPGRGLQVLEKGGLRLGVVNVMGAAFMDYAENPFDALDSAAEAFDRADVKCRIVDLHAEATAEKRALGFYADGRFSAVLGTHTHVQTADAELLPGGAAYITDVGMTGVHCSVLGVRTELAVQKQRTGLPVRFAAAEGDARIDAVLVQIDRSTGRATHIETFYSIR